MKSFLSKKIVCMIALLLAITSVVTLPSDVQAADADAGQQVVYQEYLEKTDVEAFFGKVAPTYKAATGIEDSYGYLFGGWFTEVDGKYKPIKNETELADATNFWAKFVPSYVLSVKCQNMHDATESVDYTKMRFVAGLDSTNYESFGFKVCGVSVDSEGNVSKVSSSKEYTPTEKKLWTSLFVYSGEQVEGEAPSGTKHTPKAVLGTAAKYFMTYGLDKIYNRNFDKIYSIQPFWKTLDGVTVMGLTKYAHVEDGLGRSEDGVKVIDHIINIPINLKHSDAVAGGMVEFDWTDLYEKGYTFMSAECGKSFEIQKTKLDVVADKQIVRCLTVVDIANDNTGTDVASDDIFINLRFAAITEKDIQSKTYDGTFYHFGVNEEDFSNINEDKFAEDKYDVWNIQY